MKKLTKVVSVFLIAAVAFSAFSCKKDPGEKPESTPIIPIEKDVSPVAFSVAAGEVEKDTTVALSTSTKDAEIYYESVKGEASATLSATTYKTATKYTAPIVITEDVTIYALAAKGDKVSEITSAAYKVLAVEEIPADSIRNWTAEATVAEYSVYNYKDLVKLAEIVNAGNPLAGITITQKADIKINESVLGENFAEPAEADVAVANADLINFESIGSRKIPFSGTYDGNGKVISGLYIYGDHQGLGFFGCLKNATVKNVVILDAAVINKNAESIDGSDDDRFGGLIGITFADEENTNTVENCVFVGTVGSQAAKDRGTCEYIGGIIGRVESKSTANLKNCFSLVKLYGTEAGPLVKKVSGNVSFDNCYGVSLDKQLYTNASSSVTFVAEDKDAFIAAVKDTFGIDLAEYFTKAELDVAPESVADVTFSVPAGEVEEGKTVALSTASKAKIYYELVKAGETSTLTTENYGSATEYTGSIALNEDVTIYAIAVGRYKTSEVTSVEYTVIPLSEPIPEDSIRKWVSGTTTTAYSVYNFDDLVKLAEIVNGGNDLAGITITQKENIKINDSVLGDGFVEPAEAADGVANAELINFAGIGSKDHLFAGTYDGNGKTISGLYIYGAQQGLGFFGGLKSASIKNVIILDAAVINSNVSAGDDGSDDDRFGGLVGITKKGDSTIENCIFVGTVGSQAAKNRGGGYEYIGGIIGRVESETTATIKDTISLVKLYGSAAALVKKVSGSVNFENCYGVSLDGNVYTDASTKAAIDGTTKAAIIDAVNTASGIDLTDYFTKAGL